MTRMKIKGGRGIITFKITNKTHDSGYQLLRDKEGHEYDYVGVEVPTSTGSEITIAIDALKNGWMNLYVISSLYEITKHDTCHPLIGKLTRIPTTKILGEDKE